MTELNGIWERLHQAFLCICGRSRRSPRRFHIANRSRQRRCMTHSG